MNAYRQPLPPPPPSPPPTRWQRFCAWYADARGVYPGSGVGEILRAVRQARGDYSEKPVQRNRTIEVAFCVLSAGVMCGWYVLGGSSFATAAISTLLPILIALTPLIVRARRASKRGPLAR